MGVSLHFRILSVIPGFSENVRDAAVPISPRVASGDPSCRGLPAADPGCLNSTNS